MARPRRKDGFLPLSHELGKAIALANFSKWANVLLLEILTQIFNFEQPVATVELGDMAQRHNANPGNIRSASVELQRAGVIEKAGRQHFRFNKDYELWNRQGEPRLTAEEAEEAKRTPKRISNALKSRSTESVQKDALESVQKDALKASKRTHSRKNESVQKDALKASKRTHSKTAVPTYKAHAPAPPELETLETEETERDLHARENHHQEEHAPKPGPNTAAEIQETFDLADLLFPCTSYPPLAKRLCKTTKAVWIQDAMIAASRGGKTPKTWNYITAIIDDYRQKGMSPSEESEQIQPTADTPAKPAKPIPERFRTFAARANQETAEQRKLASQAIQEAIATAAKGTKS